MSAEPFADRRDAGRALAAALAELELDRPVVLGLPRGGVPVAREVAERLGAPLDVFLVRKLGVPGHEELAMGAIASGGARVLNEEVLASLDLTPAEIEAVAERERAELDRRERLYRAGRPPPELRGRTAVVVDDGLATGSTMRAAIAALRDLGVGRAVAAAPVGSPEACARLGREADAMVCLHAPEGFHAVGAWYEDFAPTSDDEVCALLR